MNRTYSVYDEAEDIANDKSINYFKRIWLVIKLYINHFRSKHG